MTAEQRRSEGAGAGSYDSLVATAGNLFAAHDYDQVVLLLEEIPKEHRSAAAKRLLRQATELADEVADLKVRIDDMVGRERFAGLKEALERLVEIRPGLKRYEGYLQAINTYRHGAAYKVHRAPDGSVRFDPAGSEWTAGTIALLVLLPLLIFGGLYFAVRTYLADDAPLTAVVLEIDDPTVEVAIDDRTLAADEIGVPVQMTVGEHDLAVRRGTEVIHTQRFRITEGNRTVLRIRVKDDVPADASPETVASTPTLTPPPPTSEPPKTEPPATPPTQAIPAGPTPPVPVTPFDAETARLHQKRWADHLGVPVEVTDSLGMQLVVVPPGQFTMRTQTEASPIELTRPFRLGIHEVTQGQWRTVMGTEPWKGKDNVLEDDEAAASFVNWSGAAEFCAKLTDQERKNGRLAADELYRLPTEAEWEWACRAGTTTRFSFGDDVSQLRDYAWYGVNPKSDADAYPHPVGRKRPNAWGAYDMHGNVWEWCGDWWGGKLPSGRDPAGPVQGSFRMGRGGAWSYGELYVHSSSRYWGGPSTRTFFLGFRVVQTLSVPRTVSTGAATVPVAPRSVAHGALLGSGTEKIDCLAIIDPARDAISGGWSLSGGHLVGAGWGAKRTLNRTIAIPVAVDGNYHLRLRLVRSGRDTVAVHLPVGATLVQLLFDLRPNWGGRSGLHLVDGAPLGDFEATSNPTLVRGFALPAEPRLSALEAAVSVEGERCTITGAVDGKEVVRWSGPTRSLSVKPGNELPAGRTLALMIGPEVSSLEVHSIELSLRGGTARLHRTDRSSQ